MDNNIVIEEILTTLNVSGNVVIKKAWGHLPNYTYKDIISRLVNNGAINVPITDIFSEMSLPTSRALLKKLFNLSTLNSGHNWYSYALSIIHKRKCTKCLEIKPLSDYYTDNRSYDGRRSICITCDAQYKAKHRENNRELYSAISSKYRASRLQALVSWADLDEIKNIYYNCPEGYEVDHIIPLQNNLVCGLHCESNLQYLPISLNRSKSNKFDIDSYIHDFSYTPPYL